MINLSDDMTIRDLVILFGFSNKALRSNRFKK